MKQLDHDAYKMVLMKWWCIWNDGAYEEMTDVSDSGEMSFALVV